MSPPPTFSLPKYTTYMPTVSNSTQHAKRQICLQCMETRPFQCQWKWTSQWNVFKKQWWFHTSHLFTSLPSHLYSGWHNYIMRTLLYITRLNTQNSSILHEVPKNRHTSYKKWSILLWSKTKWTIKIWLTSLTGNKKSYLLNGGTNWNGPGSNYYSFKLLLFQEPHSFERLLYQQHSFERLLYQQPHGFEQLLYQQPYNFEWLLYQQPHSIKLLLYQQPHSVEQLLLSAATQC